jgi:hypothetical protein
MTSSVPDWMMQDDDSPGDSISVRQGNNRQVKKKKNRMIPDYIAITKKNRMMLSIH